MFKPNYYKQIFKLHLQKYFNSFLEKSLTNDLRCQDTCSQKIGHLEVIAYQGFHIELKEQKYSFGVGGEKYIDSVKLDVL